MLNGSLISYFLSVKDSLGLSVEAVEIILELGLHVLCQFLVFREDLILCNGGWGFNKRGINLLFWHLDHLNLSAGFLDSLLCSLVHAIKRVHSWIFGSSNSLFFPEISNLFR